MLVVRNRPVPAPGPGEILVAVEAAGVNRMSTSAASGRQPRTTTFPASEAAGRVVAIGPR